MASRTPGARRKKLTGYLKAANEIRQAYQQNLSRSWNGEDPRDSESAIPGSFPSGAGNDTGREELIIFPSYSLLRPKQKPPPTQEHGQGAWSGQSRRETAVAADEQFWKEQWEKFETEKAVADVDVRGWFYTRSSGLLTRKQRLFIGLARQVIGIPLSQTDRENAGLEDLHGDSTAHHSYSAAIPLNERHEQHKIEREAEAIARQGEKEAAIANQGGYSELPGADGDGVQASDTRNHFEPKERLHRLHRDSQMSRPSSQWKDQNSRSRRGEFSGRIDPAVMSSSEMAEANEILMARIQPFLAEPSTNFVISIFFYNDQASHMKTVETDAFGHFNLRASLDFIPTHIRVLASENLSLTEEIHITDHHGVSVISDIDDTIKHTAITSGAREIFRNVFIRDLENLQVDGVHEWFSELADRGIRFHYVSNSPWQLFPVLSRFFSLSKLPLGSFHLKQYSGMLNGIFEPVAERKRGTLEKILADFPGRKFLLIGDSGEADLEVYTDIVLANPGRVLGIFIRDVTTPTKTHFFDQSYSPLRRATSADPGLNKPQLNQLKSENVGNSSNNNLGETNKVGSWTSNPHSDRPPPLPRRPVSSRGCEEDLIDLRPPKPGRTFEKNSLSSSSPNMFSISSPQRPPKPFALRGTVIDGLNFDLEQPPALSNKTGMGDGRQRSLLGNGDRLAHHASRDIRQDKYQSAQNAPAVEKAQTFSGEEGLNRKQELWQARWHDAKAILRKHGVHLFSWRVGTDCQSQSLELVDKYFEDNAKP